MKNKSRKNALRDMKNRAVNFKEQLAQFKEKDKVRLKQLALEKGRELTEDELAELMFAQQELAEGRNNPLFERRRAKNPKAGDESVSTDSDSDDDKAKKKTGASPLSGLSRKKSIRVLEQQVLLSFLWSASPEQMN